MLEADPLLLDLIQNSHVVSCEARAYRLQNIAAPGQPNVYGPVPVQDLMIVEGSVTADRDSNARRSLECTVASELGVDIELNVVDTHIAVWAGLATGTASVVVPMGVFRVDTLSRSPLGALQVTGSSFESYLVDYTVFAHGVSAASGQRAAAKVRDIPKGTNKLQALIEIVREVMPFPVDISIGAEVWALSQSEASLESEFALMHGESAWDKVDELAASLGCRLFATPAGGFRVATRSDLTNTTPVAFLHEGGDGVLVSMSTSESREETYNGVFLTATSADEDLSVGDVEMLPLLSGYATDDDADSPTWWNGPFGQKMKVMEDDPGLKSASQLHADARLHLDEYRSFQRELDFSALPNPLLEPDDVIAVSMTDGTVENHLVSSINVSLDGRSWTASTLATRTAAHSLEHTYDYARVAKLLYGTYDNAAQRWQTYDTAANSV